MRERLGHWLDWVLRAGATPADTEDDRLHKAVLTFSTLLITVLAFFWVGTYLVLDLPLQALVPFAYQILSIMGLAYFFKTRDFQTFRFSQLVSMLALPVILHWAMGGFVNSGGIILWSLVSPLGALLFLGPRKAVPWFGAYLVLVIGSGLLEGQAASIAPAIPGWVSVLFFVMNIVGSSLTTYAVLDYFARERQQALEALHQQHRLLQDEQARSESLLLNILPKPIAERLKRQSEAIADRFPEVSVLFADIVDFTRMSANMTPEAMVAWLNDLFSEFDRISERHGLEKIKTIGDAYLAVSGLPDPRPNHPEAAAEMALEIQRELAGRATPAGEPLRMRIGIHTGPVVAGVIGTKKFIYDLWGDTVNTASRMESHGMAGVIQVTETSYERLRDRYEFEERGIIQVKGKGEMRTYLLRGRKGTPAEVSIEGKPTSVAKGTVV